MTDSELLYQFTIKIKKIAPNNNCFGNCVSLIVYGGVVEHYQADEKIQQREYFINDINIFKNPTYTKNNIYANDECVYLSVYISRKFQLV